MVNKIILLKIFLFLFLALFLISCNDKPKQNQEGKTKTIEETPEEITPVQDKYYTVNFIASSGGYISGGKTQEIKEGENTKTVKAIGFDGYHFVSWSDGDRSEKKTIENVLEDITIEAQFLPDSDKYPNIYIDTYGLEIVSKEEYIRCNIDINDPDYPFNDRSDVKAQIRGRGNSTWDKPKKPFKLKFDNKIDLFGFGKAKEWVLLANYVDPGMIRNYLAFNIAKRFDSISDTTSPVRFANVYLNNEYYGLYLVCEQVEVDPERINIDTSIGGDISFLVCLDSRAKEEGKRKDIDYFTLRNHDYVIKSPNTEKALYDSSYTIKVKDYLTNCFNLLRNNNYEDILANFDVETFADTYIINELFSNVDVYFASWYLYKDKGGKICSGPIWDFDISAGNCDYNDSCKSNSTYYALNNLWYRYLMNYSEFKDLVRNKVLKYYNIINHEINVCISDALFHQDEFLRNYEVWRTLGRYVWPNPKELVAINTWIEHVKYVSSWLDKKLEFMMNGYTK